MNVFIYNKDYDFSDSLFCEEIDMVAEDGEKFVRHADAQSQLAALREENRVLQKQLGDRWADISALKETVERLAGAERRNAELEDRRKLTDVELVGIARSAALNSAIRYNYMPCLPEDAYKWEPHWWVIEAMRAALNPNPEGASHDE